MNFCGVLGTWLYAGVSCWVTAGAEEDIVVGANDVSADPGMSND